MPVATISKEKRNQLADLVIDGHENTRGISEENHVHTTTVQNWVSDRKRERGLPVGIGASSPVAALKKLEKLHQRVKESEERIAALEEERCSDSKTIAQLRSDLEASNEENVHLMASLRIAINKAAR